MKGRIPRKADRERSVLQGSDEYNISEQTFYRWKKELGLLEVRQVRRLKDLEAEEPEAEEDRGRSGARYGDPAGGARKKV